MPVADLRKVGQVEEKKKSILNLVKERKRLNLGCGTDIREDYVNIDIQSFPGVDIVADVANLSFIPVNSIEYIVAQHILEYVPRPLMIKVLNDWKSLLSFNSVLEVRVTDLGLLNRSLYLNQVSSEMGICDEMFISMLYGKQLDMYDVRYNGFTSEFLQGVLTGIGYRIIGATHEDYDIIISAQEM